MDPSQRKDLVVLVADLDMRKTIEALLSRNRSLKIREIKSEVLVATYHDSDCRNNAVEYLHGQLNSFKYAIVMFDRHGCNDDNPRETIEESVEAALEKNGWKGRCCVVVIDPELESWVWTRSNQVPRILGSSESFDEMRFRLEKLNLWSRDLDKPEEPKKALRQLCRQNNKRRSADLFNQLASAVSFTRCRDPAFQRFLSTIQGWFGTV